MTLQDIIDDLVMQHDEHMKHTYGQLMISEDINVLWAYGAGLLHAIRTLQEFTR
jgi:hypothetical protein